jgi:hypothetical protein
VIPVDLRAEQVLRVRVQQCVHQCVRHNAQDVERRHSSGLTLAEVGQGPGVPAAAAMRDLRFAPTWQVRVLHADTTAH